MSDLALKKNENQEYDLDFDGLDLALTSSLENSVIISLGTKAREKSAGDMHLGALDEGWWADFVVEESSLGGLVHLVFKEKLKSETLLLLKQYVKECLAWMVSDGVVKEVTVITEIQSEHIAALIITLTKPGNESETFRFELLWSETL